MKINKILSLLDQILEAQIEQDNIYKERCRADYIKKMGGLMGYTEITGDNFFVFHLRRLKELITAEQNEKK